MPQFDLETSKLLFEQFKKSGWFPVSKDLARKWISEALKVYIGREEPVPLLPVIQEFKHFIQTNAEMTMGFNQMFEGATEPPQNYDELLALFNKILREAPSYGDIGPPIYMVMAQAMNTQGGFTTFLSTELNKHFKKMFASWAKFLSSPDSVETLNAETGGWFSPPALGAMEENFHGLNFAEIFSCDPQAPNMGFTSWDDFFTRTFRKGIRPTEWADEPNFVNAACESTVYNIATDVKETDTFWLKGEPYSLIHMLNDDKQYGRAFIGGTVFQGFLSVTGYHRWHSPVTGIIKKIVQVEGTYFVQSPATLNSQPAEDELPPYLDSLAFITSMTTRALIFIESDNPSIGLMCFISLGMTEVSTCEVTVYEGQRVIKGQELGMFHFGGSSHVLVFRPETNIKFLPEYTQPGQPVGVRAGIATVS